jgi:hypothetical protein
MSIETYVERARRLHLNPTEVCIACGSEAVERVRLDGARFCHRHVDWERAAAIRCSDCEYEVGLTCGADSLEEK